VKRVKRNQADGGDVRVYKLELNRGKAYEVGVDRITMNGKRKYFLYKDCRTYDKLGWYNSKFYLPNPFDLCFVKTLGKVKIAWWTGKKWYGKNIEENDSVSYWILNKDIL